MGGGGGEHIGAATHNTTSQTVDSLLEAAKYVDDLVNIASTVVSLDSKDSQGQTAMAAIEAEILNIAREMKQKQRQQGGRAGPRTPLPSLVPPSPGVVPNPRPVAPRVVTSQQMPPPAERVNLDSTDNSGTATRTEINPTPGVAKGSCRAKRRFLDQTHVEDSGMSDVPLNVPDDTVYQLLDKYEALLLRDRLEAEGKTGHRREPLDPERTILKPDWRVYADSSVFESGVGGVASELYKSITLPRDKAALLSIPHTTIEDFGALSLMKSALYMHQLALSTSFWKDEKLKADNKLKEYKGSVNDANKKYIAAKKEKEAAIKELKREKSEHCKSTQDLKRELVVLENQLSDMSVALEREKRVAFNAGREAGKVAFLRSDEYKSLMREHRFNGAKDFRNSTIFGWILISKAADAMVDGFMKAVDYMVKEKLVVPGFNMEAFEEHAYDPALRPSCAAEAPVFEFNEFPEFNDLAPDRPSTSQSSESSC